ncbi:MAG: AraC family transcriptional regulator [Saccharofermentans sp.]|nr:AraC family transcriptional regulator [Saccharofermentans sp.]
MCTITRLDPYDDLQNWKDSGLFIITGGGSFAIGEPTIILPTDDLADSIMFLFVESGSAVISTESLEEIIIQGRCAITDCNYHPAINCTSDTTIHLYTFCGKACLQTLGLIDFQSGKILITDYSATDRRNLLLQLEKLDRLKNSVDELSVLLRSQIFQNIITKLIKVNYNDSFPDIVDVSLPEHVKICIDFINKNYASEISLDTLASEAGINKYSLSRDFTALIGTSPIQYLKNKRIDVAKGFLKNSSLSIRDVGIAAGIPDTTNFIRTFKKSTGTTPLKYRNLYF